MLNTLAPTKYDLDEYPEGNIVESYRFVRFCDNAFWTAIYMAYRGKDRTSFFDNTQTRLEAWNWYVKETESWLSDK